MKYIMKTKKINIILFIFPALLMILIFTYLPIIETARLSLFRFSPYSQNKVFIGLYNYIKIFSDSVFYTAIRNNFYYATVSIIFQVGFGMILAIILESKLLRGTPALKGFYRNVLFVPSLISITAIGLVWYFIYSPEIGLLNQVIGIFNPEYLKHPIAWLGLEKGAIFAIIMMSQWQFTGYIMVLFMVAIQKIPSEIYEAAEIDGANGLQKALVITIPSVKEMILVATTITIIGAFKLFAEIYVITEGSAGPYNSTQVLGTYLYQRAFFNDEMGYASAIGFIIFLITFSLSLLQIKLFRSEKKGRKNVEQSN
jgi:raffinose/stachyose/melibiose transport system permease protein